jgi:hypothetical protein
MLQEDISLASAWHGNVRPGFSPDDAYQGPAASERKKLSSREELQIKREIFARVLVFSRSKTAFINFVIFFKEFQNYLVKAVIFVLKAG